jgi:hypothetical protein
MWMAIKDYEMSREELKKSRFQQQRRRHGHLSKGKDDEVGSWETGEV